MLTCFPFKSALKANLACLLGLALGSVVQAQTISNTASIQWQIGDAVITQSSNTVSFNRQLAPPQSLTLYQFSTPPGTVSLNIPTTVCHGSGGDRAEALQGVFAGTSTAPASLNPATTIEAGQPLVIVVNSPTDNRSSTAVDTLIMKISTASGDSETLTLTETGANTGNFVGIINTAAIPPTPIAGDCVLSVQPGDAINLMGTRLSDKSTIISNKVNVLVDPYGVTFDSGNGNAVNGTQVTLINTDTNQPAEVFGQDGVALFPATVTVGSTVTDSAGTSYVFPAGNYRFPFVRAGHYKLLIKPVSPYQAPSLSPPSALLGYTDVVTGKPYVISDASYGAGFSLSDPAPVKIDVPLDKTGAPLIISKTVSKSVANIGDSLQYMVTVQNSDPNSATGAVTVTDVLPPGLRLLPNSVRANTQKIAYKISGDGKRLSMPITALAPSASATITYVLEVRPDAVAGVALNRASASETHGAHSAVASAAVRIETDGISDFVTIIGRITEGGCLVDPRDAKGVGNVRVMLEDGSYVVTDSNGRYHFDGVRPGSHVVQVDPSTFPSTLVPVDCAQNTSSAGSAISRFVNGQGGALLRADFRTVAGDNIARAAPLINHRAAPPTDQEAAATNRDWLEGQQPGVAWLYPAANQNPRTKATRVAIKHLPGQTVRLFVNGHAVSALSADGARKSGDGQVIVDLWRAIDIDDHDSLLTAEVRDASGALVATLTRNVHFAANAIRAELVRDKSVLIADGVNRPVIAVRLTDREGKPIHHGQVGDYSVAAPYFPAIETDAQLAKGLAGLDHAKPVWHVEGEDGLAYIELEPTTASGSLNLTLPFRDGDSSRTQRIDAWLSPGNRPWTVVGLAEGTVGFNRIDHNMQNIADDGKTWHSDGRLAIYVKGRIAGKWLLTLAYDSAKVSGNARFGSVIDPKAYYTVYADRSDRRYDASSVRKIYIKLERPQFYALFGDYDTGISEPKLAQYTRAFNGVKAEYHSERATAVAFAADTPYSHRREEIQGNGLSGPYQLAVRDILPNSEAVTLEVRDRLHSDQIISSTTLVRFIDYNLDYVSGQLRFTQPILSRDTNFNPQFIIVNYDVDGVAQRVIDAGGRITLINKAKTLKLGATLLHDETDTAKSNLGGIDLKFNPNPSNEVRAEVAVSHTVGTASSAAGAATGTPGTAYGWLLEAEHHGPKYDLLGYYHEQQAGFGVGQTNIGELGTRKFGIDARVRVTKLLSIAANAYQENYLSTGAQRDAAEIKLDYRAKYFDAHLGFDYVHDKLANGATATSELVKIGATKRLFNNKLELDVQSEFALNGQAASVDFPAKQSLIARYAITKAVTLVGAYEIADGQAVKARTARVGFDVKPWTGAKIATSLDQQTTSDYGPRTFAAYGLAQSLPVNKHFTVDATLDGNKTLHGINPANVLNPLQPVAAGGALTSPGTLTEDFTAVTAGVNYRNPEWTIASRAEYRDGQITQRYGVNLSALRQIDDGRSFGSAFSYTSATQNGGPQTKTLSLAASWANRPDTSRFAWLDKAEVREDSVRNAIAGQAGPIGGVPLTVSGDVSSKRVINSFSLNWSPTRMRGDDYVSRSEFTLFWGTRYVFDSYNGDDLKGWSNTIGSTIKFDLGRRVSVGGNANIRENPGGRSVSFSAGPVVDLALIKNSNISIGYNVVGYRDLDYQDSRYTRKGVFVTLRLKFDQTSLAGLGLLRR